MTRKLWDWRQLDSHKQRLLTGLLISIPLAAMLAVAPYWSWLLLVGLASAIGLWEYENLVLQEGLPPLWRSLYFCGGVLMPISAAVAGPAGLHFGLVAALFAGFSSLLFFSPLDSRGIVRLAHLILGWLYIPYLLSYVMLIGRFPNGRVWMFFIFAVVVAGDAGAFYCGKRFGRRKLYERVSPNKTIEGAVGGFAASALLGGLYGFFLLDGVSGGAVLLMSGVLAVVGQIGDLIESMIKRMNGKKDSSGLLPGHGGLLDRLDSLLFVFPSAWLFAVWLNQGI